MSKKTILILVLFIGCSINSYSQTQVYQYGAFTTDHRSIVTLPNGDHAATESAIDNTGRSDLHFTIYDQAGNILLDKVIFTDNAYLLQNVDVEYFNNGNDRFLVTMVRGSNVDPNFNTVELIELDLAGNILQNISVTSNDPDYINLFPMDAIFDPNSQMFVICGSATATREDFSSPFSSSTDKRAFLLQVDMNFNIINMEFYNSYAGGLPKDYDIATKVKLTQNGQYYLMGSENVDKGLGEHVAGIRNMLIDPNTLNTIWSTPVHLNRNSSQENSVDMMEMKTNNGDEFIILINSTDTMLDFYPAWYMTAKWWIYRIDPTNGIALYNNFETTGPTSYFLFSHPLAFPYYCADIGYRLQEGNSPGDIVVSGLKYPTVNRQCHTMAWGAYHTPNPIAETVPFMATINVSNYPTTITSHLEYYSLITGTYWGLYGSTLYSNFPYGDFFVLNFLSEFSDRLQTGNPYGMIAPVGTLTTKFLDISSNTNNGCDDVRCNYFIAENQMLPVYPPLDLQEVNRLPVAQQLPLDVVDVYPDQIDDCASGHYKPAAVVGSQSELLKSNVEFYPNPLVDALNIDFSSDLIGEQYTIKLQDVTGKSLLTSTGTISRVNTQIPIPGYISNGFYYLVFQAGRISKKEKVVLSR